MRFLICLLGAGLLLAADEPRQKAVVSNTQHLDFPAGGQLRFVHSTGDLTIEAWDQPGIEMTTIKSTKEDYDAKDREKAAAEFQKIQIETERKGDELVVTTKFPHLDLPPPTPFGAATNFDLEYRIKAPRNARVSIDHNVGEVHVEDISGEIHVTARQGLILLHLPEDGKYAIDAKSGVGAVNSDFPGTGHRAGLIFGHHFTGNPSGAAQKLTLRIRYGDVVILKENSPAPPPGNK
ncbi:MAG TPA: hypothetical protein VKG79_07520 [Bryobacteraceae bacterium]|nr:hypothetical protein [Bryobacteraceae bacterium]